MCVSRASTRRRAQRRSTLCSRRLHHTRLERVTLYSASSENTGGKRCTGRSQTHRTPTTNIYASSAAWRIFRAAFLGTPSMFFFPTIIGQFSLPFFRDVANSRICPIFLHSSEIKTKRIRFRIFGIRKTTVHRLSIDRSILRQEFRTTDKKFYFSKRLFTGTKAIVSYFQHSSKQITSLTNKKKSHSIWKKDEKGSYF